MKVLVKTPASPFSGYGQDGCGILRALVRLGADVYWQPGAIQAPLPPDVAALLTKTVEAPFDLVLHHVDPTSLEATVAEAQVCPMIVGWTMWEYTNFKNLPGRTKFRKKYQRFNAVVGYDDVTCDGFKEHYKGPILQVQGGFDPEGWPEIERDWNEEQFYYCMIGMLHERKDPFASIRAFSELKHEYPEEFEPARLSLKTQVPGLHSAMEQVYPWLRIYYDIWPTEKVRQFYAAHHVLLAPSRGEGKNVPALEFQSTGGVVIATNWGGHKGWLDPSYAYPLDYSLAPVSPKYPTTLNARADVEHLKELILHTFRNRGEAREKGRLAAQVIPPACSWDAALNRLLLSLKEHVEGGERLWTLAQMARETTYATSH